MSKVIVKVEDTSTGVKKVPVLIHEDLEMESAFIEHYTGEKSGNYKEKINLILKDK